MNKSILFYFFLALIARDVFKREAKLFPFGTFPENACEHASQIIGRLLKECFGRKFLKIVKGDMRKRYSDQNDTPHCWLEVGRIYIDVTADQFTITGQPIIIEPRCRYSRCGNRISKKSGWHQTHFGGIDKSTEVPKNWNDFDEDIGKDLETLYQIYRKEVSIFIKLIKNLNYHTTISRK